MNIHGYKKRLKEMKRLLKKEQAKKESITRAKKVRSLERNIPQCQSKIKELQNRVEVHALSGKFKDHTKLIKMKEKERKHKKKKKK